jgi:hypothetical protein
MEKKTKSGYILCMVVFILLLLLLPGICVFGETIPDWFIPLREAVYEQKLTADEIAPLYQEIANKARASLSGAEQYIALSRCEYMMGRAYQYEERKNEAAAHYGEGITWAQRSLENQVSDKAWQMMAENISQSCAVHPVSYAMANGLKVEKYAKNALSFNKRNAAAQIMIAARWVYAPAPFHNYGKGIEMMSAVLNEGDMDKDDMFNVYSAIGYE